LKHTAISKLIPKMKVDKRLWEEIRLKAAGDESQKIEAVRLLFRRQYHLPEESKELVLKLADKQQPDAVRIVVARDLSETEQKPHELYVDLLEVLG